MVHIVGIVCVVVVAGGAGGAFFWWWWGGGLCITVSELGYNNVVYPSHLTLKGLVRWQYQLVPRELARLGKLTCLKPFT